ncbi:MAG TPA: GGDEF domain-containing protein, partial [Spirochaetota bacterium]|nr:GGDEF domain-containing protein [Spirochaetota bacterium]
MSRDIDLSMLKGICDDYALQGIETLKERFNILVHYDLVTGLPNRTLFISRLEDALKASKQNGSSGAIFAVDIDDFRKLSDTYGYLVGDELLRIAGEKLREA